MLGWTAINPVLVEIFTDLSRRKDIPVAAGAYAANWEERSQYDDNPQQKRSLTLKVISLAIVGNDMTLYREDPQTGALQEYQAGYRRFTLNVQARTWDHTDEAFALGVLGVVQSGLARRWVGDKLRAVKVSVVDILPVTDITTTFHNERRPAASMDVVCRAAWQDDDPIAVGWIETIDLTTHLKNAGTELPVPPNVDGVVIPPG